MYSTGYIAIWVYEYCAIFVFILNYIYIHPHVSPKEIECQIILLMQIIIYLDFVWKYFQLSGTSTQMTKAY